MKVQVTFKTPDALDYAIEDCSESEQKAIRKVADKFIEYDEYVVVEIDTVAGTCVVVPVR